MEPDQDRQHNCDIEVHWQQEEIRPASTAAHGAPGKMGFACIRVHRNPNPNLPKLALTRRQRRRTIGGIETHTEAG
jgi:hypothetical protein